VETVELKDRQHLYNGFGNGLAKAIEMVATPALFGLMGHFVDGWLGTNPLFTILLVLFALAGMGVRMYYAYETEMKAHEAAGPWAARARKPSA
jgi:hypothetical protein